MIKWGVLGTGSIANTFIESLKTSKESELFGIASRSYKRAKEFSVEKILPQYEKIYLSF